ncbi:LRR receptor-like serine/threonine-protein kinase IOS1 isoform X2 [Benincasa hispida]|uniref:LRR receptor-like serine/threonine-protein kinase IOS1 isoform X2 n=1 Tax=Benincasa hispida TaxID=102211 RepID=UPI0018FF7461|nr:LRR receptor-like serine/threonine-protein kinase IOS1 isoform X2 [Benincasa hispida]
MIMEILRPLLFGLLGCLAAVQILVLAQDQTDAAYISTGESQDLTSKYKNIYERQFWNLRYFSTGTRNCYNVSINRGTKYLIRASFLYGNYDGFNRLPKFNLYVGQSLWGSVEFTEVDLYLWKDIIHIPLTDNIYICLININQGTPFISALEFRPLPNTTYTTTGGSLSLYSRANFGTDQTYRFGYDVFDRIWLPFTYKKWTNVSTSNTVDPTNHAIYEVPSIVMSTAATPTNSSSPLEFKWNPDEVTSQYYAYMSFAEIVKLQANQTRVFNVNLNGQHLFGPLSPIYLSTKTFYSETALYDANGQYEISLVSTENSTLPPLINAFEVYKVINISDLRTDTADVNVIMSIKLTYGVNKDWQADPCLPKAYPWSGLICNNDTAPRIISLDLSSSDLTGEISPYIFNLSMLQTLDLSNNSLSGKVPDFLANMPSLKVIKLDKNNLTGPLPPELLKRVNNNSLTLSVEDNPNLDGACASDSCAEKKKKSFIVPVVASVGGLLVVLTVAAIIFWIVKLRNKSQDHSTVPVPRVKDTKSNNDSLEVRRRQFTYSEIVRMTENFARPVGEGGSGRVYLGHIENVQVAVKMLSPLSAHSYQQFQTEVKLLMRVYHGNLTSLVGYLNEKDHFGLIYEYMTKGNLAQVLSESPVLLTWEDRLRIAIDAAQGEKTQQNYRVYSVLSTNTLLLTFLLHHKNEILSQILKNTGLEYLHHGCKPPIVHRDVKTTNILLTDNFQAKLADFGLSKSFPNDGSKTHMSTTVAGTPGYFDPEYYTSNRLTEKSDVYSFGVVLLEIITCRPVISRAQKNVHIIQWATTMIAQGDIRNVIDPRLKGEFDSNSAWKSVEIAMACVSSNSSSRPTMNQVVTELKNCLAMEMSRKTENPSLNSRDSIETFSISINLPTYSPEAR